jgi:hypothetical protein
MAVKIKELKKTAPKLILGAVTGLQNLLPQFKTPTYQDVKKIDGILETLKAGDAARQTFIQEFFKKHKLGEKESIGPDHPLAQELFSNLSGVETSVHKEDISLYSLIEFNASIDGINLNYNDRKFLEYWLVKSDA